MRWGVWCWEATPRAAIDFDRRYSCLDFSVIGKLTRVSFPSRASLGHLAPRARRRGECGPHESRLLGHEMRWGLDPLEATVIPTSGANIRRRSRKRRGALRSGTLRHFRCNLARPTSPGA